MGLKIPGFNNFTMPILEITSEIKENICILMNLIAENSP